MTEETKFRIDEELRNDRLWKAKEILQGTIKSNPYDEEVYLEYAKILYHHQKDYLESGKYFLLTNTQKDIYLEAINFFVSRHPSETFIHHFPRQFKKIKSDKYPKNLIAALDNNVRAKKELNRINKKYQENSTLQYSKYRISKKEKYLSYIFVMSFLFIFLVGIISIVQFIFNLF